MKIRFFDDINQNELVVTHAADSNNRTIRYNRFEDCMLTGYDAYYPNALIKSKSLGQLILPLKEDFMSLKSGTIYEQTMEYDYEEQSSTENIESPVFFFICNVTNYYHFLYDAVPYLITFFELRKKNPNLKLLMNYSDGSKSRFFEFVTDTLSLIGISSKDIIIHKKYNRYKEIYVGSSLTHDKTPNIAPRSEVYEFFNKIADQVDDGKSYPKKIYISRRSWIHNNLSNIGTNYTTRRRLMNEDELVEMLQLRGFEEVFCENMSMIEKINMFHKADVVVGPIGGGMCNLLFSTKNTKAISLVSPTFMEVNERFLFAMDSSNLLNLDISSFYESTNLKTGMRVNIKSMQNQIGEIKSYNGNNTYNISLRKKGTTGCESTDKDQIVQLQSNDLIAIDNGLNSPWRVDISKLEKIIK